MHDDKEQPIVSGIYIDLDSLFDVRMGILNTKNPELIDLNLPTFYKRKSDHFIGITDKEYEQLYDNRNEETLSKSLITNIVDVLIDMVIKLTESSLKGPIKKVPFITINEYPYKLKNETKKLILLSLAKLTKDSCDIFFINKDYNDLTPEFVKNNFQVLIMYDYGKWLNSFIKPNNKHSLINTTLIVPKISADGREIKDSEFDKISNMFLVGGFINLVYADIFTFCSYLDVPQTSQTSQ